MEKQLITTILILLFFGIALAPMVQAEPQFEEEFVEVTTEFIGFNQVLSTTRLTKAEVEDLHSLCEQYENKIKKATTKTEMRHIFTQILYELDNYGLLYRGINPNKFFRGIQHLTRERNNESYSNLLCFVYFRVNDICLAEVNIGPAFALSEYFRQKGLERLEQMFSNIHSNNPIRLMNFIMIHSEDYDKEFNVYSLGLLGFQNNSCQVSDFLVLFGFSGIIIDFGSSEMVKNKLYIGFSLAMTGPYSPI